ncbi:hypothetical protein LTR86_004658 [Recurvomyces mirabilis]|nr:hypothetical protein LTR86_004658 [Recurvomyces mirabilis]
MPLAERVRQLEEQMRTVNSKLSIPLANTPLMEDDPDIHSPAKSFQGDSGFQAPIEAFNQSLHHVRQKMGIARVVSQSPTTPTIGSSLRRTYSITQTTTIRVGSKTLPFPVEHAYQEYLDFYFTDINPCHPCISENDFRAKSAEMLSRTEARQSEKCFLAVHYMIFAMADMLREIRPPEQQGTSPGWQWYQRAEDLVGRQKFMGQGDLSLLQYLIFEAFYLMHEDRPNGAYLISGVMCRLCFQFGLHQQSRWAEPQNSFQQHQKQRIFWTAYFLDRRIALSCGRPYGMNDRDIDTDEPTWLDDKELYPDRPLPAPRPEASHCVYLACMIAFARFTGHIWDKMYAANTTNAAVDTEAITILDAQIRHWTDTVLPKIPLVPATREPEKRHLRQHLLVTTLASDIVLQIVPLSDEANQPSSFRFHMTVSLSSALLILATLLCRPLIEIQMQDHRPAYIERFRQALYVLQQLGSGLQAARRVIDDLKDITNVVVALIEQPSPAQRSHQMALPQDVNALFPYGAVDFAQQTGYVQEFYPAAEDVGYDWNTWNGIASPAHGQHGYGAPWL